MSKRPDQVIYTAKTRTTGGRDGRAVSDDGLLDVKLAAPRALGGAGNATNPEQLFAAGYSACFMSAIKHVAVQQKVKVPAEIAVNASVDIGPTAQGFGLAVALDIELPGLAADTAQQLIDAAHQVCPYSNATRGNIEVVLRLV